MYCDCNVSLGSTKTGPCKDCREICSSCEGHERREDILAQGREKRQTVANCVPTFFFPLIPILGDHIILGLFHTNIACRYATGPRRPRVSSSLAASGDRLEHWKSLSTAVWGGTLGLIYVSINMQWLLNLRDQAGRAGPRIAL